MKLGNYVLLGLTLTFAAILIGVQVLYVVDTRNYLAQQLEAHAQETATSIALAIGGAGRPADTTLAKTILRPVFDRGQFRRIAVIDSSGKTVVSMALADDAADAPGWFVHLFSIDAPGGEALITAGWKQSGRVVIEPLPALAYAHLWNIAIQSAAWLAVLFVIAVAASRLFLSIILRSLVEIEAAAHALGNRTFRIIESTPRARELQSVVKAFNTLTRKIRSALEFEESRAQKLQHDAFNDALTGLLNRRGLEQQLQTLFQPGSGATTGVFALFEIDGLAEYKSIAGFQRAEDFMREAAEILRRAADGSSSIAAHINDATFVLLRANVDRAVAGHDIAGICISMQTAIGRAARDAALRVNAGAVFFEVLGQDIDKLLKDADLALARARGRGDGASELVESGEIDPSESRGSLEWRTVIQRALAEGRLSLMAQRVLGLPARELMHREITVRLDEADGQTVPARLFVPMALRHRLGPQLDAAVFDRAIARLAAEPAAGCIALNVSGQSISDAGFLEHLGRILKAAPALAARVIFEFTEASLLEQPVAAHAFTRLVRSFGSNVGIDNFYVSGESLKHLHSLLPAYVKLTPSYSPEAGEQSNFVISSLGRITRPLDVPLIALGVERGETVAALTELAVSGAQGYAIDMPALW
jgi:EAL domain-containing protein (putative c-di-GMP-specific phosphodiesterase class I)/GGDEF domain-containing protein